MSRCEGMFSSKSMRMHSLTPKPGCCHKFSQYGVLVFTPSVSDIVYIFAMIQYEKLSNLLNRMTEKVRATNPTLYFLQNSSSSRHHANYETEKRPRKKARPHQNQKFIHFAPFQNSPRVHVWKGDQTFPSLLQIQI